MGSVGKKKLELTTFRKQMQLELCSDLFVLDKESRQITEHKPFYKIYY